MSDNSTALNQTLDNATRALLQSRNPAGHWEGELSSSALSTATALFALSTYKQAMNDGIEPTRREQLQALVNRGIDWLCSNQNTDGGWGDTVLSISNISTTALCWAALSVGGDSVSSVVAKAEAWLSGAAGSLEPARLAAAIKARYGRDKTFSVPILTMCALAGRLDSRPVEDPDFVGSTSSRGIFWRADVLVRRGSFENGGRGRPPSNEFSSSPRTNSSPVQQMVRSADPTAKAVSELR